VENEHAATIAALISFMSVRIESCIESIRYAGGALENLEGHSRRMNRTRAELYQCDDFLDLRELIQIPVLLNSHVYKCRVTYEDQVSAVEWELYQKRRIETLRLVHDKTISYAYKYRLRDDLDRLYSQRKEHDDVLIVRNGYLTDTYVCNIALFDGKTWWTPSEPLLNGTQRALLLEKGTVVAAPVRLKDLPNFTNIRLFNAMMPWNEAIDLPISRVIG
jgi:4-amino-4-deoxychorismate lyase